ncbi:MAG: hypothetical protein KVP17_004872 [Porospora cf. gigantea B]|uniref:uncharacterized protein n=1 Tax=Porospora cf. gigantea B TaxID=2853592 RepID=UPI00357192B2|nr:MAG: hypothetical protein KVP17_004872 [Porospora cf. gigantea B]
MTPLVTQQAPDFTAQAVMPDGEFKELTLSDFKGKYVLLFFWPLDFTFVCPSEVVAFDRALEKFESRNVVVLGCSVDSHFTHYNWRITPRDKGGIGSVRFPMISDLDHSIAKAFNVHVDMGLALRGTYIIDRAGIIQHSSVNNLPLGRNVEEYIRVIDALQFSEEHGDVCPANWKKGDKGMPATITGMQEYMKTL